MKGDRYAKEWPVEQFARFGIKYEATDKFKSDIYLDTLPLLNSAKVRLLDHTRMINQLLDLERVTARGGRESIDHPRGGHDDLCNAACAALLAATAKRPRARTGAIGVDGRVFWHDEKPRQRIRVVYYTPEEARELKEKGLW